MFSYLGGLSARDWLALLRENRFSIDSPYWPRAALVGGETLRTSLYRAGEARRYGHLVADAAPRPPLFILGHWRSGTTHLQRLLALDDRFAHPTLYQSIRPHTFLSTEAAHARWVALWLPRARPMDRMALRVDSPEEDELALGLLTRCSPFFGWVFPRSWRRYERYLTFREVPDDELSRWKGAFVGYLKKLTWRYRRPLVLKSPPHTGRIKLLVGMFPGARFVHIHRDPYTVFQSTCHLWSTVSPLVRLQRQDPRAIEGRVLRQYRTMYDAFFEERSAIGAGRFCEVRFEDLERDPVGELERVYRALDLTWPRSFEVTLGRYLDSIRPYRKNVHPPLPAALRRRIADTWERSFEEWGYRSERASPSSACHS